VKDAKCGYLNQTYPDEAGAAPYFFRPFSFKRAQMKAQIAWVCFSAGVFGALVFWPAKEVGKWLSVSGHGLFNLWA
jgi:hypothetical protein